MSWGQDNPNVPQLGDPRAIGSVEIPVSTSARVPHQGNKVRGSGDRIIQAIAQGCRDNLLSPISPSRLNS
ncbi:MAG: hypothetical protein ACRC8Y_06530 [Chroococcales cyanobacterium]